ncbi:ubiquitin-conjugating enzyme-related [Schistosoma mansoni]|uniref:ubiquitin-conjugating enzyme-related n=1 Tax=Schistosoma mansoni TaxID=6183 RepID=UPI00022DC877|nr:ubiquitin-conjugating enzyme-related [Schistosoma mansoni]|eukprot:XP_018653959.1 ubiquitin-conjugating enzyme-related [Schistosoma mansoni]
MQPTYEDDLRPVGIKLSLASQHVTSAHRLFSDRFTFVLWLMRCFVTISGIADDILEQVYSALRNAALIDPAEINTVSSTSLKTSHTKDSTSDTSLLTKTENVWSDADEIEAISCVEMLTTGRSLLYEAFRLIKDYRIRKMWHLCDFRSNLFEKHIGVILRLFESFPLPTHEQAKLSDPVNFVSLNEDVYGLSKPLDTAYAIKSSPDKDIYISDQQNPSNNCTSSATEVRNKNEPIHFLLRSNKRGLKIEGLRSNYTIATNTEVIIKLAKFLFNLQKDILEQLTDLNNEIMAWLHEYAAQCIQKSDLNDPVITSNTDTADGHRPTIDKSDSDKCTIEPELINNDHANNLEGNMKLTCKLKEISSSDVTTLPSEAISLLSTILPNDIIVKGFEDRIDLYSIMIIGASGTPYEHCLFFFDVGLASSYPTTPPQVHYYSFGNEKVNPNLYVDGHICLSLLGTWNGHGSENWSAETSNLLQLAISIQALILNSEPYFNEAGYEERRTDPIYQEQSRIYNEAVVALNLQSMISIVQNPFPHFRKEIIKHCVDKCKKYLCLLENWASLDSVEYGRIKAIDQSSSSSLTEEKLLLPKFPLPPVSKGFQLSVRRHSIVLSNLIKSHIDLNNTTNTD